MNYYMTKHGDVLDEIVYAYYKSTSYLEIVLEENRHIAAYGPILPEDVKILLPDIKTVDVEEKEVTIWD